MADFLVGMTVVPSLFFCEITNGCRWSHEWLSWAEGLRWLSGRLRFSDELVQFGAGSLYSSCDAFEIFNFYDSPTRYRNDLSILGNPSLFWGFTGHFTVWMYMILLELLPCLIFVFFVATMVRVAYKHDRAARILSRQLRFNHHVLFRSHDS